MRLIRFRFSKAMGLSGAGPSPTRRTASQPAVCLSRRLAATVKLVLLGTTGALLRISGAPVFPIRERIFPLCSSLGASEAQEAQEALPGSAC